MTSRPAEKAPVAFQVVDLARLRQRLDAVGYATTEDEALPGYARCYVSDPFRKPDGAHGTPVALAASRLGYRRVDSELPLGTIVVHGEAADWSTAEVRALLAGYGRSPQDLAVSELLGGADNRNLLVEADGERLVLRRYDATPPNEVPWELALLGFLTTKGFPTARLVERMDGGLAGILGGKPVAFFRFVAGRHPAWNAPGMVEQVANLIAQLHAVTDGLRLSYPRSRMDSRHRLAQFQSWVRKRPSAPDEPALARFAEQVEQFAAAFAVRLAPHEATLPRGVVHHDAHAGNLLCNEAGRIVALLDFDDAHEAYRLADVAVLVDVWGTDQETQRFSPARAAGMVQGYAQHRPLGAAEWALLPDFLALYDLADATSYASSRIQRGVPADQALGDCNQYAKFLQRTAAPDWRDRLHAELARPI